MVIILIFIGSSKLKFLAYISSNVVCVGKNEVENKQFIF